MSMELTVILCLIYAMGVIITAIVLHVKGMEDSIPVGVLSLFWPAYVALIVVTYPISLVGRWGAKAGGWR